MANPVDLQEVERLVQRFYQPGHPQEIKSIEGHLQALQRSPQGWQIADSLLQSQDQKVRFFGALTFTVKIHRDWESLNDSDSTAILERLLYHTVRLVNANEGSLVVKKLCGALVAYYLHPSTSWERCVLNLMACFVKGEVTSVKALEASGTAVEALPLLLNDAQLLAAQWFATTLAEEGRQSLAVNVELSKQHKQISANVEDVVLLLQNTMSSGRETVAGMRRAQDSMKCFQSWVMYAQRAWVDKALELGALRSLTPIAIKTLPQEDLYEEATEMLSDILQNFSAFLTAQDFASLTAHLAGDQTEDMVSELKNADFNPLATACARLLLSYGDANVQDLAQNESSEIRQVVNRLTDLLRCEGYPGVDDEVCAQALDFWTTYVEFVTDSLFTTDPAQKPLWMERAQQQVVQIIEACWEKIRLPPAELTGTWDNDGRSAFQAFRSDVQDLLQTSYTLLGLDIFQKFAWLALKALEDKAWLHLEATLFCINALSEAVADEIAIDDMLSRIFGSSLFEDMANPLDNIPAKTRQIAVTMITKYIGFFERRVEHLPTMLNFLFDSVKAPAMANVAAKAINTACSSCRSKLTGELHAFLQQYENVFSRDDIEFYCKEKVIGGIAAIIQALGSDEQKIAPLGKLIHFVERDVQTCFKLMNASEPEQYQTYAIGVLRCLVNIAKALQTPDDVAIDVDVEGVPALDIWGSGPGYALQVEIIDIVQKLTSLMDFNSDVMEAGCQILRAGYKETLPGLFVFPPSVTVDFVCSAKLNTSRLELVIDTGSAMLSRQSHVQKEDMETAASLLLNHSMDLLAFMSYNPSAEPEVASSIIDLADKMIPRYISSMTSIPSITSLLTFILACLASPEILPKRSAAHFWATFVNRYDLSESPANLVRAALDEYGLQLCRVLIFGIAGDAPRSMLDYLSEPLKKLVFAQPMAKGWLSQALNAPDFPSRKVTDAQKRVWLQKVMSLRGARKTNNEVRDFWIACHGHESAFAF